MGKQKSASSRHQQATTTTRAMSPFEDSKPAPATSSSAQHRQQYHQPTTQQQQQPVYRPSYPAQQYPSQQYQQQSQSQSQSQYPPQHQQQQSYQPPYMQQQFQQAPETQFPSQQTQAHLRQQQQQQQHYHHDHDDHESSPPQSPDEEASPILEPKRTSSFKGLPPIRRGSTFGISLKEATSAGMVDNDIPPVPSLSPNADLLLHDHSLLGGDVAQPADYGTNISIGQNSEVTLVGADSSRTRRTSLGIKDKDGNNRDSQHNSHRSSSASHSLQIDPVGRDGGDEIPEVPRVPAHYEQEPQHQQQQTPPRFAAPPQGWIIQSSELQQPLNPVSKKWVGANNNSSSNSNSNSNTNKPPKQPASFGMGKETGEEYDAGGRTFGSPSGLAKETGINPAAPVSPIQSTFRTAGQPNMHSPGRGPRPSNPPSAAARHPDLFPNVPHSPTSRSRAGSAGQTSTHSVEPVSRFSTDSNQDGRHQQGGWVAGMKGNGNPKMDDEGRTRTSLLKNIGDRISRLPQRDSRGLVPDHRPHSTEPTIADEDYDSEISQEAPQQPKRKRTSALVGPAIRSRSSMDEVRYARPGSPTNSQKAPSTHSEKKKSLFGKMTAAGRFKSSTLAKAPSLSSVHESTATSNVNSSSLKSKYFAGGFSGLAGKLKRQGKDGSQQQQQQQQQQPSGLSRVFTNHTSGAPMTTMRGSMDEPSEPPSPTGPGSLFNRPKTASTAGHMPQAPPPLHDNQQESRPRRGSMSGIFSSMRGKGAGGPTPTRVDPEESDYDETPPPSAALRPPPLFTQRNVSPTGPTGPNDPDHDSMFKNGPRAMGRPASQNQQQNVGPSPLVQAQSQSRLNLDASSVESDDDDEEDHLVRPRDSSSPSLTTARTSGPSQRGSGPSAAKQDYADPSDYHHPRPINGLGAMPDMDNMGGRGAYTANGAESSIVAPAKRQGTPHAGALPAFMADVKPPTGLRKPSIDKTGQTFVPRKPLPGAAPASASGPGDAQRPPTPGSPSEPPAPHPDSAWGSSADITEDKTLKQDKQLPGPPGTSPPRGIVSEPSIASIGPASGRYPSPQPSAMSVVSMMQNQGGEAPGRESTSMARPDPQKSGWKSFKTRVSTGLSQPKTEGGKQSGGGKLFSVLKRGSKAPAPLRGNGDETGQQRNSPMPSPMHGSGPRPMYTVVARPGQIPAGAGAPSGQNGQGPSPAHWDNPQALGALGRDQQQPGAGAGAGPQPSRLQQMMTGAAPEIQYGTVPIPKGYTAVHGEGGIAPTQYHLGNQQYPYQPQPQPGQYGVPQQTFNGQYVQGQFPPQSPPPPGSQHPQHPQHDAHHDAYSLARQTSVAESHAPSTVSVPRGGVQATHEGPNSEGPQAPVDIISPQSAQPPLDRLYDNHNNSSTPGVVPTPVSRDEFVLPIQGAGAGAAQDVSQPSRPLNGAAAHVDGSSANGSRTRIMRGDSVASEGARSNESGVMGGGGFFSLGQAASSRPMEAARKPDGLHLKVSNANLASSDISRENSSASASSEGGGAGGARGHERVAQRVEVFKVVSPTNSIGNDTIKGGNGNGNGPSSAGASSSRRARSIDVGNPGTRSRAGSKLAAEPPQQQQQQQQETKRAAPRDSIEDLYDATPKLKQGVNKPASKAPETPSKGTPQGKNKVASPAVLAKAASPITQAKAASPITQAKASSPVTPSKAAPAPVTPSKAPAPSVQAKVPAAPAAPAAPAVPKTAAPSSKETPAASQTRPPIPDAGQSSFHVELADTADARMRTLRLNGQEEKIFYEPDPEAPKMTATSYPGQEWNPYGEPEFWTDD